MSDRPLRTLTLDALRKRTSVKWRLYPEDVLPLWVAEMDVPVAESVVRAVTEAMRLGDTGYTIGTPYVEAMRRFARDRWDWSFAAEQAVVMPDVMLGVVEMLKLVTDPGDAVVVSSPVYPPFYEFVRMAERVAVEAPLGEDLRIDLGVLERTFATVTKDGARAAYLLCSPHNPTGVVHTREELVAVRDLARRYGVRVVADEIHAPLVHAGHAHTPYLTVDDSAFALLSASKAWNLAGLKAAVAVAAPDAVDDLRRMPEVATHAASHLGEIAHAAALDGGRDWLDALLEDLDENRRLLAVLLAEHLPTVGYRTPEGTYLAWLGCRALGLGDDPAAVFLEKGRVALNAGPEFGTGGEGHARLNLATTPEILTEAVRRMAASLVETAAVVEPVETAEPDTPLKILFVCTANICRSAFAETLARHLLGDDPTVEVASAGTRGFVDREPDKELAATLTARCVDPDGFRSRILTMDMVEGADIVLTADTTHRQFILDERPGAFRKLFTLGQFARTVEGLPEHLRGRDLVEAAGKGFKPADPEDDVADPYRRGPEAAERAAATIESLLSRFLPRLSQRS